MHSKTIAKLRAMRVVAAALCIALGGPITLTNAQTIYDAAELTHRSPLYRDYVPAVFNEDLIGQLPLPERAALSDVKIVLPPGILENQPLAIGADVPERIVYFPIQTIAFIDDLAALAAWLAKHDCSFEPATLYAGMLVSKSPPAGRSLYPNPRTAFGLGDNIWDDPFVKKSSNDAFKTAIFFALAHELGHIRFGHASYDAITSEEAQRQEMQADTYAIDAMRHVGVPPLGMFQFFAVLSRMEGNVSTTHPLSGSRLLQITAALRQSPGDFVPPNEIKGQWAPVIEQFATKFEALIPVIDNPVLREQLARQAQFASWSELQHSCRQ